MYFPCFDNAEKFEEDIDMRKDYETLIERSIELGALEARLVPANEIVFDDRSFLNAESAATAGESTGHAPRTLH